MRAPASMMLGCLLAVFVTAPAWAQDTDAPEIEHARVERAPLGQPITVRARITDRSAIFAPSLLVRQRGKKEFDTIELRKVGPSFEATIPADQVIGDLEYVIEAFDEHGNGPARAGTLERPILIRTFTPSAVVAVPAPEPDLSPAPSAADPLLVATAPAPGTSRDGGVVTKWWFWTLVGVAAAGAGVGVYLATRGGTPSMVELEIVGPSPTGGL